MSVLKRILAIVVMILSALGAVACLGGIIGAWAANAPLTDAVNSTIDTAAGYISLAGNALQTAGARVEGARTEIESIQSQIASVTPDQRAALAQRVSDRVAQPVTAVRTTTKAVSTGAVALNQTLESVNRIPGVAVPTFTDELNAIDARLEAVTGRIEAVGAAVSDANVDGARVSEAATAATAELQSIETALGEWETKLNASVAAATNAKGTVAGAIDAFSLVMTLLLVLFGAGQVSLCVNALGWFRGA